MSNGQQIVKMPTKTNCNTAFETEENGIQNRKSANEEGRAKHPDHLELSTPGPAKCKEI